MAAESAEAARTRLRWAVNVSAWQPLDGARGDEWRFLAALLPPVRRVAAVRRTSRLSRCRARVAGRRGSVRQVCVCG
jgi:hypothetical protein